MATKVRSGGGTGPPPSPPPQQPAGPSHSAAQRAAYTEAHQSTHTRPSAQGTRTQEEIQEVIFVKTRRQEKDTTEKRSHRTTVRVGLVRGPSTHI